ncbi:hypothetical protein HCG45_03830 [Pseudomonas fulva]|uniref:hypothetical protein n=1 Tax=Pseudomonas fulva TaxID=47880 RepID=UPI001428AC94|nr:hypothetical protein [Pseudomonas fulva]NIX91874.1 hypothetical protein [Pseudomonas fulva]
MRHEFDEVLNDLVDYFLLGDIQLLERFKQEHGLPDDLAYEFTHHDSGDRAVRDGVVLPVAGVDNLPYHVVFTLDGQTPKLREASSRLKHQRGGYSLKIEHGAVMLYTWRILQYFTPKTLGDLLARYREPGRPVIELDNGWYDVEVLAGACLCDGLYEPTFEFVFNKRTGRVANTTVDTGYNFSLRGYFD